VWQDFEPAFDAPGISDAPNFYSIRRQFGGLKAGQHHHKIRLLF
jgi:hypothetical protein